MKTCSNCGMEKSLDLFSTDKTKKDGLRHWCKECVSKYMLAYRSSPKGKEAKREYRKTDKYKEASRRRNGTPESRSSCRTWNKTPRGRYSGYIRCARTRRILFNLTFDQFMTFWQKPCHYCGVEIKGIGLDRLNNDKGYTIDNVVPCCAAHNRAKQDMSAEQFIQSCTAVHEYTKTKL